MEAKARLAYALEEAVKKSREEGKEEGREETKREIVGELLKAGMDVLRIANIVHLDELEVEEIKKSLENSNG